MSPTAFIEACANFFIAADGIPIWLSIDPSLKLISELVPSIAPVPRIRSVWPCNFEPVIAIEKPDPCGARVLRLRRRGCDRVEREGAAAAGTAAAATGGDDRQRGDCAGGRDCRSSDPGAWVAV